MYSMVVLIYKVYIRTLNEGTVVHFVHYYGLRIRVPTRIVDNRYMTE